MYVVKLKRAILGKTEVRVKAPDADVAKYRVERMLRLSSGDALSAVPA